jgi:energy-coupling factor transport system ATP-binding protein
MEKRPPQPGYLNIEAIAADCSLSLPHCNPCRMTLEGIRYRYSRQQEDVLKRVSVELEPSKVYLLEGPNGAGKSTLAKLLSGVLLPVSGAVLVNGRRVNPWNTPGSIVAYHFQNPDVQLFSTTVEEEIRTGLSRHLSDTEQRSQVGLVSRMFGVQNLLTEHPLDLPFVLRKRVALAATTAMGRPWLILDEPTLGQDDVSSEALVQGFLHLVKQGTGIIVISHSESFKKRIAGIRLSLEHGTLGQ